MRNKKCVPDSETKINNTTDITYPDFTKKFVLSTDALNEGAGAVLSQGEFGKDRPVAYASRSFNRK